MQDVAALWPDAAPRRDAGGRRAPGSPPAPTRRHRVGRDRPEEKKGVGGRVMDFLRGSPPNGAAAGRGDGRPIARRRRSATA